MAWNGSNNTCETKPRVQSASSNISRRRTKGLYVGLGLVLAFCILGIVGYLHFFQNVDDSLSVREEKKASTIKVIKPQIQTHKPVAVQREAKQAKKAEPPIWERPMPRGLDPDQQAVWKRKAAYEKRKATDERLKRFLEKQQPNKALYKTGTEQVLDWIFTAKVGDVPPPPLPPVPQFELNHIDEILNSVNEIEKDDDAETAFRKQAVDEAKIALKEYLAKGGAVEDFLEHYRNELVAACETKGLIAAEIHKQIEEEPDSKKNLEFIEKANKILEEKGIPGVELSEDQKDKLAEGFDDHEVR